MFKKIWRHGRKDSMIRDSFSLFAASMMVNFGAFLFHLIMVRLLGLSAYATLSVLLSLVYILNVPVNVIQTTITKFVSQFKAENEVGKIKALTRKSSVKLFIYALVAFILVILASPFLASFLKISVVNILLLSPAIIFVALLPVARGTFQGLQKFKLLSLNLFLEISTKLIFGVLLVLLGMKLNGAVLAITLSFAFPTFIGAVQLRKYLKRTNNPIGSDQIYKYTYPVLLTLLFLTLTYSVDIILVKHFFDEALAGFYAAIALAGKIIFFATVPISQVMFPKSVEKQVLKRSTTTILKKALSLVALISFPIIIFYFLFPGFILNVLFGSESVTIFNALGYNIVFLFGITMTVFSFFYLLAIYNLSINNKNFIYVLIVAAIFEIVLIYLIHNTLFQIVSILNAVLGMLLIYMVCYTIKHIRWLNSQ